MRPTLVSSTPEPLPPSAFYGAGTIACRRTKCALLCLLVNGRFALRVPTRPRDSGPKPQDEIGKSDRRHEVAHDHEADGHREQAGSPCAQVGWPARGERAPDGE